MTLPLASFAVFGIEAPPPIDKNGSPILGVPYFHRSR
jgi:hypothetical protein